MKISSCLILTHLLFSLWAYQPSYAQSGKPRFESLTTEQGLAHHFIMTIMQDRKGFLWFGTGTGLDKYDGYRFTNYKFDPRDTTSLAKNQVLALYEDREGFIWVGTSEGTCRFNPHTETWGGPVKTDSELR